MGGDEDGAGEGGGAGGGGGQVVLTELSNVIAAFKVSDVALCLAQASKIEVAVVRMIRTTTTADVVEVVHVSSRG